MVLDPSPPPLHPRLTHFLSRILSQSLALFLFSLLCLSFSPSSRSLSPSLSCLLELYNLTEVGTFSKIKSPRIMWICSQKMIFRGKCAGEYAYCPWHTGKVCILTLLSYTSKYVFLHYILRGTKKSEGNMCKICIFSGSHRKRMYSHTTVLHQQVYVLVMCSYIVSCLT